MPEASEIVGSSSSQGTYCPPCRADSDTLENRRNALTAANAHGHQGVAALHALELVERLRRDDGARGSDGMAQTDPTAVGVDLRRIQSQFLDDCAGLRGEGFIGFDH